MAMRFVIAAAASLALVAIGVAAQDIAAPIPSASGASGPIAPPPIPPPVPPPLPPVPACPAAACAPHPLVVSGDASVQVANTLTVASVSASVTYTLKLDVNADPFTPPSADDLDAQAKLAYADASARAAAILSLLGGTAAERVQTTGVSLQQSFVWVQSLQQSVANGYSASTAISFRIASAAPEAGTLLADLISAGATAINSVSHTATDDALEAGKQKAIAKATSSAVARAKAAARALVIGSLSALSYTPALEFRSLSVSTSNSAAAPPPPVRLGLQAAEVAAPVAVESSESSDSPGQTTVRAAATLTAHVVGSNLL